MLDPLAPSSIREPVRMDSGAVDLVLPWPPSVNTVWRTIVIKGAGRTLLSAEGREYRLTVQRIAKRVFGLQRVFAKDDRLEIELLACPPDNRRRDLDNILKATLDAITHAGIWHDDSLVDDLRIKRGLVRPADGLVFVKIRALPATQVAMPC
jgi:crossover junction endodeoxyribonuclease RusA